MLQLGAWGQNARIRMVSAIHMDLLDRHDFGGVIGLLLDILLDGGLSLPDLHYAGENVCEVDHPVFPGFRSPYSSLRTVRSINRGEA